MPSKGLLKPKNANDHEAFIISCIPKAVIASLFFLYPFFQTRYSEIAIKMYKVVHTGPNTQLGGANTGFTKVAYQVPIAGEVNIEPKAAAKNTNKNDRTSFL